MSANIFISRVHLPCSPSANTGISKPRERQMWPLVRWSTRSNFSALSFYLVAVSCQSDLIFTVALLSLCLKLMSFFFLSALRCSESSWEISIFTRWRPPIACLVPSFSSPTCSLCSLYFSICSWPSSTTPMLKSSPTLLRKRASSRSEIISRR